MIYEIGVTADCDSCSRECGAGTEFAAFTCDTCSIASTWCEDCVPGEEQDECPECEG